MLYFSELKNKKVLTEDGVHVGKLQDIIFLALDKPIVTKIVVSPKQKNESAFIVPSEYINKINSYIYIRKEYKTAALELNEIYAEKNLLDKQIIDIKGSKVVRVNDIVIQSNKPNYYIAGVDIGILGILRWLRIEDKVLRIAHFLNIGLGPNYLSWADIQPLELARGHVQLKQEQEKLKRIRPEDLADYLETTTTKNIAKILNVLDEEFASEVIESLNVNYQQTLFKSFTDEKAAKVISVIDPDEAVDILLTLSQKRRDCIVSKLQPDRRSKIEYLLGLAKTPIGDFITSQYIIASPEDTVRQVINRVRKETADFSYLYYIYIINKEEQLIGVVNLHELLMQDLETQMYRFMVQNVVVVHLTTPEEIAINKMIKYRLQALPVTGRNKKILGIVTIDDLAEFIKTSSE